MPDFKTEQKMNQNDIGWNFAQILKKKNVPWGKMLGSLDLNGDTLGSYQRIQKSENHFEPYTQELFFYTTQQGSR